MIQQIWERGITVPGVDPALWRKDYVGAWIRRDMYGQEGIYGWQIDHLCPVSQGGDGRYFQFIPATLAQ